MTNFRRVYLVAKINFSVSVRPSVSKYPRGSLWKDLGGIWNMEIYENLSSNSKFG